jgi:hypothetical protein
MLAQVVNNCQGPHYVQLPHLREKDKPLRAGGLVILQPGLNLVETKQLAEMRKNPGFDELFKLTVKPSKTETADPTKFGKRFLEVVGKELEDKAPLAKLSFEEARGVIAQTLSTDLLADWMKTTKPGDPLVKVLSDRAKELTSGIDPQAA